MITDEAPVLEFQARLEVLNLQRPWRHGTGAGRAEKIRIGNAAADGWRNMLSSVTSVVLLIVSTAPVVLVWPSIVFLPLRYAWRRWGARATS